MKVLETSKGWYIKCPCRKGGCAVHPFFKKGFGAKYTALNSERDSQATWQFNGDLEKPTITPSLRTWSNLPSDSYYRSEMPSYQCHFNLKDGVLEFCGDNIPPDLNGKKVPLEDWTEAEIKTWND